MDDLPGLALDDLRFRLVRLAVDNVLSIDSITLNGVEGGSLLSIGDSSNLEVVLVTNDENGFDLGEAAVLHYRVKAGEAEITRGSVLPVHHVLWPAVLPERHARPDGL